MAFPLFKDLTKSVNDLLKKGYPSADKYAFRVESDTTSESGIQFTPSIQKTASGVEGEMKAKFTARDATVTTVANLKEEVSLEVSPTKAIRGFKWAALIGSTASTFLEKLRGKLTIEHRTDYSTTAVSFDYAPTAGKGGDPVKANLSSVVGSKDAGFAGGFDVELSQTGEMKAISLAVLYSRVDMDVSLFSKNGTLGTTVGANFFQKSPLFGRDTTVGGEITYDLGRRNTLLTLGAQFKPAETSTVKTRIDTKGLMGVSLSEKLRDNLTMTWTADWNVFGEGVFQYGVKLAFK